MVEGEEQHPQKQDHYLSVVEYVAIVELGPLTWTIDRAAVVELGIAPIGLRGLAPQARDLSRDVVVWREASRLSLDEGGSLNNK